MHQGGSKNRRKAHCMEPSPLFQMLHFTHTQWGFVSSGEVHLALHTQASQNAAACHWSSNIPVPSGDRQLLAPALLQVASWLLLALQHHALWIHKQMQLKLRQAVLFLPKKSLHLYRTVTIANSNNVEVASQICCWFYTFEVFSFQFNFRLTQLPGKALKPKPIHSSSINLHATPNTASWTCSINACWHFNWTACSLKVIFMKWFKKSKQQIMPMCISQHLLTPNSYLIQRKQQFPLLKAHTSTLF